MGRKEDMAHRAITGIWDNVVRAGGIGEPLRTPLFRRIWFASLLSNFGLLIQAVGAAWSMTQLTPAADMVALVQTALMMPDRKSVVSGKSVSVRVDIGGRRIIKKKTSNR